LALGLARILDLTSGQWQAVVLQRAPQLVVLRTDLIALYGSESSCTQVHYREPKSWRALGSYCVHSPISRIRRDSNVIYFHCNDRLILATVADILADLEGLNLTGTTPRTRSATLEQVVVTLSASSTRFTSPTASLARVSIASLPAPLAVEASTSNPASIHSQPGPWKLVAGLGAGILATLGLVAGLLYRHQLHRRQDRLQLVGHMHACAYMHASTHWVCWQLQAYTTETEDDGKLLEWSDPQKLRNAKDDKLSHWHALRSSLEQGWGDLKTGKLEVEVQY